MQSPLSHTSFEIAAEEGHQFTVNGITRIKLLISIADVSRQWIGWYEFVEDLAEADDDSPLGGATPAEETIHFGAGAIDRAAINLRRSRTVDGFASGGGLPRADQRTARIHDAQFSRLAKGDASNAMRLDIAIGFELIAGRERETVRTNVAMLSLRRPRGDIHPALGYLVFRRRERCARATMVPRRALEAAMHDPVW